MCIEKRRRILHMSSKRISRRPKRFLDLFTGSGSVSRVAEKLGYEVRSLDTEPSCDPTYLTDILDFDYETQLKGWIPDVIWASPPCTEYSIANTRGKRNIRLANKIVRRTLDLIRYCKKKNPNLVYIIENPQTGRLKNQRFVKTDVLMRDYMDADYCRYGYMYRKRTRFWTNLNDKVKPRVTLGMCRGSGKCPAMRDGRHILDVGSCDPHQTDRSISRKEKYSIPAKLLRKLLSPMVKTK